MSVKSQPASARQARPLSNPLAIRQTPEYDPNLPVFDRYGVAELCALKGLRGITANRVKAATIAGELHAYFISNRLWWSEDDVTAWIHSMRRPAGGARRPTGGAR